jgi:hypothetical protein
MNIIDRRVYGLKGEWDEPDRHTLFTEQPTVLALQEHLTRDRREAQPDLREYQDMTTA